MEKNKTIILIGTIIATVCSAISYFTYVVVRDDGLFGAKCTYEDYSGHDIEIRSGDSRKLDNGKDIKCLDGIIIWEAD